MTRHFETGGPSRLPGAPVPFRTAPSVPFEANESDRLIQAAVTKGKDISKSLADILRQSSLADNEESHLHEVLSLAEELRDFQSPVEVTIGLVGDTGVGKSSLINSLLERKKLAKTANSGEFGTSTVTEYRKKRDRDRAAYTIEIERMRDREMDDLLRQSVVDYRRYHLRDRNDDSESENAEIESLRQKAQEAWDTITAAFSDQHECTERFFQDAELLTDEIIRSVFEWKDQIPWTAEFSTGVAIRTAESEDDCKDELDRLLRAWMWPFIKVTRIYLEAAVLQTGVVLVDLPGFRDINSARIRITEARLYHCDEVFVVANIGRAVTNMGVDELVVRQLGNDFSGLRRSQGVSIICTKSEDLGQEHEILRDVENTPGSNGFNPQAMQNLKRQMDEVETVASFFLLKAKRDHYFISARNKHVKERLIRHYSSRNRDRRINVHCVSNTLYTDAVGIEEEIADDRRASNFNEKNLRARQLHESSGINKLRDFVEEIPSKARIEETRHFLGTRLERLLQKFGLWLNASVADLAASQPAASEFVQELQTDLKMAFDASVLNNLTDLNNAKRRILEQPLNQGVNGWEAAALAAVSRWERWSHQTILAFWCQEGAHATARQTWTNWNEEIIKMMVDDIQPREEEMITEDERAFRALITSAEQALSSLSIRLEGFNGVDHFIQTFDRRERNLEYEINSITTWFFDKLQTIFHDLLRAHGTSYVMQHMRPMYDEIDSGSGVTKRRIAALKLRIQGDRINARLFKEIRDLCMRDVSILLDTTKTKLQDVVDGCSADIESDLELVRSDEAPSSDENDLTNQMFEILEVAKQDRENALREFEAGIRPRR